MNKTRTRARLIERQSVLEGLLRSLCNVVHTSHDLRVAASRRAFKPLMVENHAKETREDADAQTLLVPSPTLMVNRKALRETELLGELFKVCFPKIREIEECARQDGRIIRRCGRPTLSDSSLLALNLLFKFG